EGVRIVEFLDLVDLAVLAIAEEGGGVFTLAINTEDGGLFLETGAVVGTGGVREVVLDGLDLHLLQIETELLQTPLDALLVSVIAPVTHEDGIQGAVRGVPVALGVMPAGFLEDADRGEGNGDDIHVLRLDARLLQTELCRLVGHAVLGMLVTHEAFFLDGGDQLSADIQRSGRIMAQSAGKSKNGQAHRYTSLKSVTSGGILYQNSFYRLLLGNIRRISCV